MLDEFDLKLIQALQKNGRASYVELAESLGVVEGTVRKRVNALQKSKIIKISAEPNLRVLGYNFISVVGMQVNMSDLKKISASLAKKPNICYLAFVTGRYDLLSIIISRSTEELAQIIENDISTIPGILRTETFINLNIVKGGLLEFDTIDIVSRLFNELKPLPSRKIKKLLNGPE
ncbi:MAG: Lrp/AsnC family transcriptional regulator [Dehalococcoidales bacterium]|nr:Lrp/AsnC family transcriptional regulator [Dehalococcoidales bacterium]